MAQTQPSSPVVTPRRFRWRRLLQYRLRTLLMFAAVSAISLTGCNSPSVTVKDVTKPETLVIPPSGSASASVSGLTFRFRGRIDGNATITASNWSPIALSGNVDSKVYHDHFSPSCALTYIPHGVTSGQLQIEYVFH